MHNKIIRPSYCFIIHPGRNLQDYNVDTRVPGSPLKFSRPNSNSCTPDDAVAGEVLHGPQMSQDLLQHPSDPAPHPMPSKISLVKTRLKTVQTIKL